MKKPTIRRRLIDAYAFPGFRPLSSVRGVFGDPQARVVTLVRRSKKLSAEVAERVAFRGTTGLDDGCATYRQVTSACTSTLRSVALSAHLQLGEA